TDFNLRRLVFVVLDTERSTAAVQCLLCGLGSRRSSAASNSEISLQHLSGGTVQTTEGKLSVMVQIQLPLQRPLLLHHLRQPLRFTDAFIFGQLLRGCNQSAVTDTRLQQRLAQTAVFRQL